MQTRRPAGVVLCAELCRPAVRRDGCGDDGTCGRCPSGQTCGREREVPGRRPALPRAAQRVLCAERDVPTGHDGAGLWHRRRAVRELPRGAVELSERPVRLRAALPGQPVRPGWLRRQLWHVSAGQTCQTQSGQCHGCTRPSARLVAPVVPVASASSRPMARPASAPATASALTALMTRPVLGSAQAGSVSRLRGSTVLGGSTNNRACQSPCGGAGITAAATRGGQPNPRR